MKYDFPFMNILEVRFNNKKRSHLFEQILISTEAEFVAQQLIYVGPKCKIKFKDGQGYPTSSGYWDSDDIGKEGYPILPEIEYPAGGRIEAELLLDCKVTRKNSIGTLVFCGVKKYEVPKHFCHATGCNMEVPPKLLMCLKHWRMVPREMRAAVWRHYRPGQEIDKKPSREYLVVMDKAINAVYSLETKTVKL